MRQRFSPSTGLQWACLPGDNVPVSKYRCPSRQDRARSILGVGEWHASRNRSFASVDNTIVIFTTDNGAEVFTWPDGGMTPFRATKGTVFEGWLPRDRPSFAGLGKIKPGTVENGIFSGLDWLPTLSAAAGNPNITQQLLQGVRLGDRTYKNHLDGYDQTELLLGKGSSARHELYYFGGPKLGAIRIDDFKFQFYQQPYGWPGTEDRRPSTYVRTHSSARHRSVARPSTTWVAGT